MLERAGASIVGEDDASARLAFVALDEPEGAAARLKARGLLLNVTDRPELCDFTVPSILERGPVLIAVGTGGASAGLAKALRLRLEALLPASLGALADAAALPTYRRVAAALGLMVLTGLAFGLAQAPSDPYFADSLQAWEQGRFVRFHGLAQWIGWLWPYAAMAWLLTRLGESPSVQSLG